MVTNTNDNGPGSLRWEITKANLMPGANVITFAIPGVGPYTINVRSSLPAITDPLTIDGFSQPGWAGTPIIELNGAGPERPSTA